jgi:hypothetical protein
MPATTSSWPLPAAIASAAASTTSPREPERVRESITVIFRPVTRAASCALAANVPLSFPGVWTAMIDP